MQAVSVIPNDRFQGMKLCQYENQWQSCLARTVHTTCHLATLPTYMVPITPTVIHCFGQIIYQKDMLESLSEINGISKDTTQIGQGATRSAALLVDLSRTYSAP